MGLFSSKAADKAQDRSKPHEYQAPKQPPSSGHVACVVCGLPPEDVVHSNGKPAADTEIHWS